MPKEYIPIEHKDDMTGWKRDNSRTFFAEQRTEVKGTMNHGITKPDGKIDKVIRNFLETPIVNKEQVTETRAEQMIKILFRIAKTGRGLKQIKAIELLFNRGYGKEIEHVELTGHGTITGLTINVQGALPDSDGKITEITEYDDDHKTPTATIEKEESTEHDDSIELDDPIEYEIPHEFDKNDDPINQQMKLPLEHEIY